MPNALYAQSGGVTAVINNTARAVIQTARESTEIDRVFGARFGILGALREELVDTAPWPDELVDSLEGMPGGAFGSCRFKLGSLERDRPHYERLIAVLRAHDIRYVFYNGGNDSADTALKVSRIGAEMGFPVAVVGVPKTVDNDLPITDCCPGFASAGRYLATSLMEASLDVASMASTSTRVFVMEVMGRHAGWLAAACGVIQENPDDPPHLILFPERVFDENRFLERVSETVAERGYCVIAASEGIRDAENRFLSLQGSVDAFGHQQLGGVAPALASLVQGRLNLKTHWAVPDYLQRSGRHLACQVDLDHAYAVGAEAVRMALRGENGVMPVIVRQSDVPYRWRVASASLQGIANVEKKLPDAFISDDGYAITEKARRYLHPLVAGPIAVAHPDGIPPWPRWPLETVDRKLPAYPVGDASGVGA